MEQTNLITQGVKFGYARVSTVEQDLQLQLDALRKTGCSDIYQEKSSGKNIDRPELNNLLRALRTNDTVVVWRLDRLARSLTDLIKIIKHIQSKGANFESLHEKIDTSSATGKLIFHIFGSLAEFERDLIRERTIAGLKAARARGRKGGRKHKLDQKAISEVKKLVESRILTITEIAKRYNVARKTIYNVCK